MHWGAIGHILGLLLMVFSTAMLPPIALAWAYGDGALGAFAEAYAGFEIMAAMYRSVLDGGQVALPLTDGRDELAELGAAMPDKKPIWSFDGMAEEFH